MTLPLSDEMLTRWRKLAQVDISVMQADTAITELSRAVLLLLDAYLDTRDALANTRPASFLEQLCATFGIPPNMIDKPGSRQ